MHAFSDIITALRLALRVNILRDVLPYLIIIILIVLGLPNVIKLDALPYAATLVDVLLINFDCSFERSPRRISLLLNDNGFVHNLLEVCHKVLFVLIWHRVIGPSETTSKHELGHQFDLFFSNLGNLFFVTFF